MKRSSRTLALGAATLVLTLALSACSDNDNKSASSPSASVPVTESPSGSPNESGSDAGASPTASPEIQSSTGEYVGLSDGHSIEIKTSAGPTVFQVSSETAKKLADWDSGTKVKFKFSVTDIDGSDEKQRTIIEIEKE